MNRMYVLIVEDEPLAAAQLASNLAVLRPGVEVAAVCDTIKSTVEWFNNNPAPDLAFFDIHLGDGLSFEIFDQVEYSNPVIFLTAYEQYAIKAFKVNSVDYLLKPINRSELEKALLKFENLKTGNNMVLTTQVLDNIVSTLKRENYKERFLVKVGQYLRIVDVKDILYFYSFEKGTYAKLIDGKDYLLDNSLELLEEMVDPKLFFRINRKFLVTVKCINDVIAYSNSRLKLKVKHQIDDDFLVAREKVRDFKGWLEGK